MTSDLAVFYVLAALLVTSAVAMIASRNTVHAVLLLAGNFLLTALVYLLLEAPFLALIQVIVYAGAIMVLFLFVVMLMGPEDVGLDELLGGQRVAAVASAAVLGAALIVAITAQVSGANGARLRTDLAAGSAAPASAAAVESGPAAVDASSSDASFGSPRAVGQALLTQHILPFEAVSILLLVAVLGAVVLARETEQ